jgi:hypothetical protein
MSGGTSVGDIRRCRWDRCACWRTGVLVGAVVVLAWANKGSRVAAPGVGWGNRDKRPGVSGVEVIDAVLVGTIVLVSVGTNWVTACSVSATAVFKFATAKSTMFKGTSVAAI